MARPPRAMNAGPRAWLRALPWRPGLTGALLRSAVLIVAMLLIVASYRALRLPTESWAIVSMLLVSHAHATASARLALLRVGANIIGAGTAFAVLAIGGNGIPAVMAAMVLVGIFCHLARLDDGLRSAYVSTVIVLVADRVELLAEPLERVGSVVFGSCLGVLASLVIERIDARTAAPGNPHIAAQD